MPLVERTTFAGGEISPRLWARHDLAKHQTAVRHLSNFAVLVEGGVTRIPGTRFVAPLRNEARPSLLIPFQFSVGEAYMLVLNDGVIRFHQAGGVIETTPGSGIPYELAHPYADAELPLLRWTQAGNTLFLVTRAKPVQQLTRLAANGWTLGPYITVRPAANVQNLDQTARITPSGPTGSVTLTASKPIFRPGHVGGFFRLDEENLSDVALWKAAETIPLNAVRRNAGRVYLAIVAGDSGPNAPVHTEGDVRSGGGNVVWRHLHPGYGFAQVTAYVSPTLVTAEAATFLPDNTVASGTYRWTEPAWTGDYGYPENVILFENTLVFARDEKIWRTKPGDLFSFEITDKEDSALALDLVSPSGKLTRIQWLLSSGIIVIGTRDAEFIVRGPNVFDALTVANVRRIPEKTEGSATHRPVEVDGGALFIGRSRDRIHFAAFDRVGEVLTMRDASRFARHLVRAGEQLVYQRDPNRLVWVLGDGRLNALTWFPDEEVLGWARRPFVNGHVEQIAVIPATDGLSEELWLVVRRTIGAATRRYVERMQPFFAPRDADAPTAAGAWFVDSGLTRTGAPVTTVSGLAHLEGQEVAIHADGAEHPRRTVAGGAVTLLSPAAEVTVGLPMTARLTSLSVEPNERGPSRASRKQARHVLMDVVDAAGGMVSVNGGPQEPCFTTGAKRYKTGIPLATGKYEYLTPSPHDIELVVDIVCDGTLPFTLTGLSPAADVTGT